MRFKYFRAKAGLTQKRVAQQMGVGDSAISMWEIGASLPRADMLPKLAELYKCTVDELLQEEPGEDAAQETA